MKRFLHLDTGKKVTTLQQLFIEQPRDLYGAENRLIEAAESGGVNITKLQGTDASELMRIYGV